ncbi:MAG: response regulator [Acidobacteriia bacterium]|nr:response regulator [Terriglobia bacterium]
MRTFPNAADSGGVKMPLELARVLLVHGDLAPRLALQTILQAGGYYVDVAGTPAEALAKLDEGQYELVLSNAQFGAQNGLDVLAYARVKNYHPATALITSAEPGLKGLSASEKPEVAIHTQDLPHLLAQVAELIGMRASRRYR